LRVSVIVASVAPFQFRVGGKARPGNRTWDIDRKVKPADRLLALYGFGSLRERGFFLRFGAAACEPCFFHGDPGAVHGVRRVVDQPVLGSAVAHQRLAGWRRRELTPTSWRTRTIRPHQSVRFPRARRKIWRVVHNAALRHAVGAKQRRSVRGEWKYAETAAAVQAVIEVAVRAVGGWRATTRNALVPKRDALPVDFVGSRRANAPAEVWVADTPRRTLRNAQPLEQLVRTKRAAAVGRAVYTDAVAVSCFIWRTPALAVVIWVVLFLAGAGVVANTVTLFFARFADALACVGVSDKPGRRVALRDALATAHLLCWRALALAGRFASVFAGILARRGVLANARTVFEQHLRRHACVVVLAPALFAVRVEFPAGALALTFALIARLVSAVIYPAAHHLLLPFLADDQGSGFSPQPHELAWS
jgi:hypothetical protein